MQIHDLLHSHLILLQRPYHQNQSKSTLKSNCTHGYRKKLADYIAKSTQTLAATEGDIAIANMRYAEAQRATDEAYERTHKVQRVIEDGRSSIDNL